MNVLIAPNAFKNALDAEEVARSIQQGLFKSRLECNCSLFPIADGGDGTSAMILNKLDGEIIQYNVQNPVGDIIKSSTGLIDNGVTAIIEMANASGLKLLKPEECNPILTTSFGTGEQIKKVLESGVKRIIIGMGGSATVDGACGILRALGVKFLDHNGHSLEVLPRDLLKVTRIDITGMDPKIMDCEVIVLCDVENSLIGENGSARVYAPQKGASSEDVKFLDEALERLARLIRELNGKDISQIMYGGSAGGAAGGLYGVLNARLENGINYFLDLTGFNDQLLKSDLIITGEGSIDVQTLHGKGPFGVALRAKQRGIPVIGIAGKVPLNISIELNKYFDNLFSINNEPMDLNNAIYFTAENIERTAYEIGNLLSFRINSKASYVL